MTKHARVSVLVAASLFALTSVARVDAKEGKFLTRSIYVPLELDVCEHLHDAILYEGETAVGTLPTKRIFQFTYYPHLERIEPLRTDIRFEADRAGEPFVGRLAITPWGVFSATQQIKLDLNKQLQRMRYKLDVRHKPVTLKMRCEDRCELKPTPAAIAAAARPPSSP